MALRVNQRPTRAVLLFDFRFLNSCDYVGFSFSRNTSSRVTSVEPYRMPSMI